MEILIKHYGNSRTTPSKIIELTCKDYDTQFTVDVTDLKGLVDVNLIENLRQVADELEEQNRLVKELSDIAPNGSRFAVSINVPPTRVKFWKNIHDDTTVEYGSVIDQTESHYIVIPDDDVRPNVKWLKSKCDVLR